MINKVDLCRFVVIFWLKDDAMPLITSYSLLWMQNIRNEIFHWIWPLRLICKLLSKHGETNNEMTVTMKTWLRLMRLQKQKNIYKGASQYTQRTHVLRYKEKRLNPKSFNEFPPFADDSVWNSEATYSIMRHMEHPDISFALWRLSPVKIELLKSTWNHLPIKASIWCLLPPRMIDLKSYPSFSHSVD